MTQTAHFESYRVVLQPLSPIHIDSGVSLEPYQYDLREVGKVTVLDVYNLDRLLSDLSSQARQEFYAQVDRLDFNALRTWIRTHYQPRHRLYSLVVAGTVMNALKAHLDDPRRLGEIHLMPRIGEGAAAYMPGSSIKGAVRTALLDQAAKQLGPRTAQVLSTIQSDRGPNAGANFEAMVFGNLNERGRPNLYRDPLRQLAFSDLGGHAESTYIDRIQIVKQSGDMASDPSGIIMYRELTRHALFGEIHQYTGDLRLHRELTDTRLMQRDTLTPKWDIPAICHACNAFYRPRLENEIQRYFRQQGWNARLIAPVNELGLNECLIRVGHHSHFECVTVGEPFRRPPQRGFGKSRSLAGGSVPLGWAKLRFEA